MSSQYCNGSKIPPEVPDAGGVWYQVPPGTFEGNVPTPVFNLTAGATVDEGNNWISISWGPLSLINPTSETNPSTETTLADYSLAAGSPAINYITNGNSSTTYTAAPSDDFFGNLRKTNNAVDAGAVEFVGSGGGTAIASVTGGPLNFGNVVDGTTSASQTLTLHNTGTATLTGIAVTFTGPYTQSGGTCGATLNAGATCTIPVVFSPVAPAGAKPGTATIAASVAVTGSPVTLNGTGVAPVVSATLTPTTHNYGGVTRNCPTPALACLLDPAFAYTLTNTGNVTLTGISQGVLGGVNATEFTLRPLLSTCGPAGGGQLASNTTLAPGGTCVVTVQFQPKTAQTTGVKNATISVTDAAGTQTSTLTGTAN